MTTYVIGDSHTRMFSQLEDVIIMKLEPPPTMYSSNKITSKSQFYKTIIETARKINKYKDRMILVCGEIDARIHIYHRHKIMPITVSGKEIESIIYHVRNTIEIYGITLKELKSYDINFLVCGIPPAGKQRNYYNVYNYADDNTRTEIYKVFYKMLKTYCSNNGYDYIDIYTPFCDSNGFIKKQYREDEVHLNIRFQAIPW